MIFTWDPLKNVINKTKHDISFEEAITVFMDEEALLKPDPDHSIDEDRFLLIGLSKKLKLLVVVHCYRKNDTEIRIISARKATRRETSQYIGKE